MTRERIIQDARALLAEDDTQILTAERARIACNLALDQWCHEVGRPLRVTLPVTLVAGQQQYSSPALWTGVVDCSGIVVDDIVYFGPSGVFTAVAADPTAAQFVVGGTAAETATNLAAALAADEDAAALATVEVREGFVVLTGLVSRSQPYLAGSGATVPTLSLMRVPYWVDTQALYVTGSDRTTVPRRDRAEQDGRDPLWSRALGSGTPTAFVLEGGRLFVTPQPTGGSLELQAALPELDLPTDVDTWDTLPLDLEDTHRVGVTYGTALELLGMDASNPDHAARATALAARYQRELAKAARRAKSGNLVAAPQPMNRDDTGGVHLL